MRRERPRFGSETLSRLLLETTALEDVPLLAESFVYELMESGSEPLLIIIDDLHLVYDAEWVVPFFRRLLPLLPVEAHMLITGRSLPPAPLWRMRSKQTLCVVEEPVMAFTEEEAKKLFASYGLREEQALSALLQTRGRAASLDRAAALLSAPVKLVASVKNRKKRVRRATILQTHEYLI
ncbi:MAG: hypothetical protein H0X14_03630 [Acidobacteria bacterium]|nr:hypothetical protein [Acidobacteriota bacterium]